MKFKQVLKISLIATALFVCLSYSVVQAEKHTFTLHKELSAKANPSLRVQNTSGEIKIESYPENKIIIDAFKVVDADNSEAAEKIADKIEVIIEKHNSEVKINTRYPSKRSKNSWKEFFGFHGRGSVYVDYHILVPEKIGLNIFSTSGDVIISDISGDTKVNVTSGDLWIRRVKGELDLETTSGDVEISKIEGDVIVQGTSSDLEISNITGDLEITSTSGNTTAENVVGSVKIDNTSGDVFLKEIRGSIQTSSRSGDLKIDQIEGGLDLETSSGDAEVETEVFPQYEYYVNTSSGDIDFSLPEDSDARIKLETSSGSINSELPLTLHSISRNSFKGELGAGGPQICLATSSGDIELGERKR
jgi:hypothetical protein